MPFTNLPVDQQIQVPKLTPEYYTSLAELDADLKLNPPCLNLPAFHAPVGDSDKSKPRLLGGYQDDPRSPSYTFNFWSLCDTFIYFAHHRVSPPPPAWVSAAHRHQTKILGTLIFEGAGEEDCLRLIVGPVPSQESSTTTTANSLNQSGRTMVLSPHYAERLAELAHNRGFDGYLLNFECPLGGGEEQARLVAAWIILLKIELAKRVGPYAEVVWYDSVVINGLLRWQDRLCHYNLPFFLSADSIFTNYTWPPFYPRISAQYFDSIDKAFSVPKTRRDIYVGVDVWGRGSHGGGGFNCYKAIEHIEPSADGLGLSVALFGQAWTWESKQDSPGRTWSGWWKDEIRYWLGPPDESTPAPTDNPSTSSLQAALAASAQTILASVGLPPPCVHGPFRPMSSFFKHRPIEIQRLFHTNFSPGIGYSWFIEGKRVMQSTSGWTDVDKQSCIGDLVWPSPSLLLPGGERTTIEDFTVDLNFDDAWLGGSSLAITIPTAIQEILSPADASSDADRIWIPLQSLVLLGSSNRYTADLVVKIATPGVNSDFHVALKNSLDEGVTTSAVVAQTVLPNGWTSFSTQFSDLPASTNAYDFCIGLSSLRMQDENESDSPITVLIGQLAIQPLDDKESSPLVSLVSWSPSLSTDLAKNTPTPTMSGRLAWSTSVRLPFPTTPPPLSGRDDPTPRWTFEIPKSGYPNWYPRFVYQNVYMLSYKSDHTAPLRPEDAMFVGTSGGDGQYESISFVGLPVNISNLPQDSAVDRIRFYIRGVTDAGRVVGWEDAASIDVSLT
ncbi:hypothetical protein FRB99_005743 [Tulasnella sp. 403]|nr:hypothetical protein FRB99_005743 [Tulasnella sp. 403]